MANSTSPFREKSPIFRALRAVIRIARRSTLRLRLQGRFTVGSKFSIGKDFDIRPPDHFFAGCRVGIGKSFTVECNVRIADDVLISSNVSFVGNDHQFSDPRLTVYTQGRYPAQEIVLEGDNLIGYGTIIIAPCRIGRGAIVGAGAVVVGDMCSNMIYGGVPARAIRPRFADMPSQAANKTF